MKDTVYIVGHKSPDTDSICSAIAYSELKNKTSEINAVPGRLGDISSETKFVLKYFGVEPPVFIQSVKVQVSDLDIDDITPVYSNISIKMAWTYMKNNDLKTLPVVDGYGKLIGIISVSNITTSFMEVENSDLLSRSQTTLENVLDTLIGKPLYINDRNAIIKGKIVTAAMKPSSTIEYIEKDDILICGDREDTQNALLDSGIALMIVTGNHEVSGKILEKAKEKGCSVISTSYDSFTTSRLILQSVPIGFVMSKDNLISFSISDYVDDIKDTMLDTRYRNYPVVDKNDRVIGSISRYHLISKKKKGVILVDHNEKAQSVNGLEDAELLEVIDHHRIADVQTGKPIYFRNEPVGSTATIVACMYFEQEMKPSKKVAGLLCSAIISDTLLLKSPTTTNIDKLVLQKLADIADIDVEKYAKELFKAGTTLEGKSAEEIFYQDFKEFSLGNLSVGIAQVGIMDISSFEGVRKDVETLMEKLASDKGYAILVLMLTDIVQGGSELITFGKDKHIVAKAFEIDLENNSTFLPGVISRKKQVIPAISAAIVSNAR